jgi:cytochrome-b5 reductase
MIIEPGLRRKRLGAPPFIAASRPPKVAAACEASVFMPNKYQLTFLATFVSGFTLLVILSEYVKAKLKQAGYDPARLILIGLEPKNGDKLMPAGSEKITIPGLKGDATMYTQVIAGLLAVATTFFLYTKFGNKSRCYVSMLVVSADQDYVERKPVLDPQVWQEFPLTEKITISPNTAM